MSKFSHITRDQNAQNEFNFDVSTVIDSLNGEDLWRAAVLFSQTHSSRGHSLSELLSFISEHGFHVGGGGTGCDYCAILTNDPVKNRTFFMKLHGDRVKELIVPPCMSPMVASLLGGVVLGAIGMSVLFVVAISPFPRR
jgi:hypothetical protein